MFTNVGGKIKVCSKVVFWVITIAAVMCAIYVWSIVHNSVALGWILLIGGPLVAWISTVFMYGFGELVEKVCSLEAALGEKSKQAEVRTANRNEIDDPVVQVEPDAKAEESFLQLEKATDLVPQQSDVVCDNFIDLQKQVEKSATKNCPNCATEMPAEYIFCTKCGTKLG